VAVSGEARQTVHLLATATGELALPPSSGPTVVIVMPNSGNLHDVEGEWMSGQVIDTTAL